MRMFATLVMCATMGFMSLGAITVTTGPIEGFEKSMVFSIIGKDNLRPGWYLDENGTAFDENDIEITGDYVQRYIIGRSEAELTAHQDAAVAYFMDKFEMDETTVRNFMNPYSVPPTFGVRCVLVSQFPILPIPDEGFRVYDGGWSLFLPQGTDLGSNFNHATMPTNGIAVFGEYYIDHFLIADKIIHLQSRFPHLTPGPGFVPGQPAATIVTLDVWTGDYDEKSTSKLGIAQSVLDQGTPVDHPHGVNFLTFDSTANPGYGTN